MKKVTLLAAAMLAQALAAQDYPFEGLNVGPIVGQDGWTLIGGTDASGFTIDNTNFSPLDGSTQSLRMQGVPNDLIRVFRSFANISSGVYRASYDQYFEVRDENSTSNLVMRLGYMTPNAANQFFQPYAQNGGGAPAQNGFADPDGLGGQDYQGLGLVPGFLYDQLAWYRFAYRIDFDNHTITDLHIYDISSGQLVEVASNTTTTFYFRNDGVNWFGPFGGYRVGFDSAQPNEGWFMDNIKLRPEAVSVSPTSIAIFRGTLESGGLAQVLSSDDQYLVVRNGVTALRTESPITIDANYTSPTQTVNSMKLRWEHRVSIVNLEQRMEMKNYSTGSFVQVDRRAANNTTDTVVDATIANPNDFIQSGTKAMMSRHRVNPVGPVFTNTWRSFTDQIVVIQT